MAQGVQDSVIIDRCGNVIGVLFQFRGGIGHSYPYSGLQNHGKVIAAVTKGDGTCGVKTLVAGDSLNALALVCVAGGDIRELRMPAARYAVRHTLH